MGVKLRYRGTVPMLEKAYQEIGSESDEEEVQLQLEQLEKQEIPKTPDNAPTPPRSPKEQLQAPMVEDRPRGRHIVNLS